MGRGGGGRETREGGPGGDGTNVLAAAAVKGCGHGRGWVPRRTWADPASAFLPPPPPPRALVNDQQGSYAHGWTGYTTRRGGAGRGGAGSLGAGDGLAGALFGLGDVGHDGGGVLAAARPGALAAGRAGDFVAHGSCGSRRATTEGRARSVKATAEAAPPPPCPPCPPCPRRRRPRLRSSPPRQPATNHDVRSTSSPGDGRDGRFRS